jgi:hypothetical protein
VWRWERERGKEDGPDKERLGCGGKKRAERNRPAAWCCLWAGKKTEGELGWAGNGERREGKVEGFVFFNFCFKPFQTLKLFKPYFFQVFKLF